MISFDAMANDLKSECVIRFGSKGTGRQAVACNISLA